MKVIVCPANDFTCPYNKKNRCTLENCEMECDEFYELDVEDYTEEIAEYEKEMRHAPSYLATVGKERRIQNDY